MTSGRRPNRLANESSPYLLQHAGNPVDWYPWGDEAFAVARSEDKPVFLSIGYATCHWCHVMERESFEDHEVADLLNTYFIAVKVDREERPDVDAVYMTVTQSLTGSGGWPMTVLLTPDKRPFFAGTYFPKNGVHGRPGMLELLPGLANAWETRRGEIEKIAGELTANLLRKPFKSGDILPEATLDMAEMQLMQAFDTTHGGFGTAPKFPSPTTLLFLLRRYHRSRKPEILAAVERTLSAMRRGGIYDHLGFGFHRYATDREWRVPHFEKMLYDQALLIMVYAEAYQFTGNELFARTVREVATYIKRDMTSKAGGFFSAEDADSEGSEGKYYIWTTNEIHTVLGERSDEFGLAYDVRDTGNFRDELSGIYGGNNILHLQSGAVSDELETDRNKLFQHRKKRIPPVKDDKILTDWNGLMIAALAKAGVILCEPEYTAMAIKAGDFLQRHLQREDGRLMKRYRGGNAGLPPTASDYAFSIWGYFELYQAGHDVRHLKAAERLAEIMLNDFQAPGNGGLFMTAEDVRHLPIRHQDIYDGALPSGNSVAAWVLLRLYHMNSNPAFRDAAHGILASFNKPVESYPTGFTMLLIARDFAAGPIREVVIAGEQADATTQAFLRELNRRPRPRTVHLLRTSENHSELASVAAFTQNLTPLAEGTTAYVCNDSACDRPITNPEILESRLE